ncbi:MAG: arsenate reductase (azurin) small subunit [Thermomicrobiales bacterium]
MAEIHTVDRRSFLKLSGLATGIVLSGDAVLVGSVGRRPLGVAAASQAAKVQFAFPEYPDVVIANISDVKAGEPIFFEYPLPRQKNMLVKLDKAAEEGIGNEADIVAFSTACSHMGAPLDNVYNHEYGILGPCPLHFSTFDLAKSGMNVMGKASDHLPQVALSLDDNGDIRAIGMFGLIYGYPANLFAREAS